ncbi:MAG: hydrogenase-4 transcriptional activator, partial [Halieaceae bacterium]
SPYGYILKPVENPELQIAIELALHKFEVEHELRETRQLLATAMECIGNILVFVDSAGEVSNINSDAEILFGCSKSDAKGKNWDDLLQTQIEAGANPMQHFLKKALHTQAVTRLPPFTLFKPNGTQSLLDGIVGPIKKRGDESGVVVILRELAEIHDPVESLPRPSDLMRGSDSMAPVDNQDRAFVLLLINPDDIEGVNEQYGREAGDSVIAEIGLHLNRSMRINDLANHYGGAVFSASLPYTTLEDGTTIADAILQDLSDRHYLEGRVALKFSIGIAHNQHDAAGQYGDSPLELFRRANWALNVAKQSGGGKVVIWRPNTDLEIVGNHDRQSGLFSSDSGRDYRNMVLLWNTMNIVAKALDLSDLANRLTYHFQKSFDFAQVGICVHIDQQLRLIGASPENPSASLKELGLDSAMCKLIENTASGQHTGSRAIVTRENMNCIPLFTRGHYIGAVFFERSDLQSAMRHRDLEFLKTLVDYAATPLANQLPKSARAAFTAVHNDQTELLYQSDIMSQVMEHAQLVAPTDATVLITGESGTGKEMIARKIHDLSPRRDKSFIIVDCGAVVASLIESELFGHTKGAFTGAQSATTGKLKEADGGTILLDEIGELPIDVQAKLLRVVQNKEFSAVGSNQYQSVDTRIIAATNVDLESSVREGSFRKDLFYRLNVFTIHAPALRDRDIDMRYLAEYFLSGCAREYNKDIQGFTPRAIRSIQAYGWPGNVRELKNRIIRAVILNRDELIDLDHLELPETAHNLHGSVPRRLAVEKPMQANPKTTNFRDAVDIETTLDAILAEQVGQCLREGIHPPLGAWLEEDLIRSSLKLHNQVGLQAAEALGIPESTIRRKVARFPELGLNNTPRRNSGWESVIALLPELIVSVQEKSWDPIDYARDILLRQIDLQSQNQSEASALAGVSPPTYRKLLEQQKLRKSPL